MTPQDTPASDDRATQALRRKAYQKPQLQIYGDLAEITQSVKTSGKIDGGSHPNQHFTS
jgi:hypothetical protein